MYFYVKTEYAIIWNNKNDAFICYTCNFYNHMYYYDYYACGVLSKI